MSGSICLEGSFRNGAESEKLATYIAGNQFGHVPDEFCEEGVHNLKMVTVGECVIEKLPRWAYVLQPPEVRSRLDLRLHPVDHAALEARATLIANMEVFSSLAMRDS